MEVCGDLEHEKTMDCLQQWFEENKKLPNKIDRILLTRFYYCMNKDIENTKKLLETNYSIRNGSPHLFTNRDPTDEDSHNTYAYADIVPLPGLTPENYRIVIHRISNPDPEMMHYTEDTKTYIMVNDCRFCMPDAVIDNVPLLAKGDIHITDMEGHSMAHTRRISIRVFRTLLKYLQEAYPIRIKAIHMLNCPSYMNKILAIMRPFVNKKVFEMIHFHTAGLESLYENVPKEMLPEEYGGKAGKIADLKEDFLKAVNGKRDYLMDPNYWKT